MIFRSIEGLLDFRQHRGAGTSVHQSATRCPLTITLSIHPSTTQLEIEEARQEQEAKVKAARAANKGTKAH